ncbi:MAG TPA: xanthine dehydrogenase accessory protein XdhC [Opitutaceae bacterium]|nr:xanthine dehydrogenase accessory protein XdhC [Opitutaceae bacterium]
MSNTSDVPGEPTTIERLIALEREGVAYVLVTLVEALGSTPQDTGAKMIVTASGRHSGTVGGGKVEGKALALAVQILAEPGQPVPRLVNWTLKGDVGMTCGGSVKLFFDPHRPQSWPIVIFGAGHIAQALVPVIAPLACEITCIDPRQEWLDRLPVARNLRAIRSDDPSALIPTLPDDAFVLFMTQGHSTDRPILQRALETRDFPFIGVIGSAAKAAVLRKELTETGVPAQRAAGFHCPVGLDFGTNHPHEIALSIAAQLLTERDKRRETRR